MARTIDTDMSSIPAGYYKTGIHFFFLCVLVFLFVSFEHGTAVCARVCDHRLGFRGELM